jgi:hypothetical protein
MRSATTDGEALVGAKTDPENPIVPYFISFTLHQYLLLPESDTGRNAANAVIAAIDFLLHVGAWVTAVVLGIILIWHEQDKMHAIPKLFLQGSFITLMIAAGHVILLWFADACLKMVKIALLPPSIVSGITGMARASVVFTGLTLLSLSATVIESGIAPTEHILHQLRLLSAMLGLELFGLACTLNNHRVELRAVTVSAS